VDYQTRQELLKEVQGADLAAVWAKGDQRGLTKLAVVHHALCVRARQPAAFGPGKGGAHRPLAATGPAAEHAVAFGRGDKVVTVVTRWPLALEQGGGWRGTTLPLPEGRWRDALCGGTWEGEAPMDGVLAGLPVALLERAIR
jgi:(1->4)-alpha-D-glucan 1-alpha-D-glucosylmutase